MILILIKNNKMNKEQNIRLVKARYPDAYEWKYAKLSMVIWCPMLNCRLSGFFRTFEEAWADAVEWERRKMSPEKFEDLKKWAESKTNN